MSEHVCTCEHPKQEPGYFCGPNCGPGNDIRHPKWQRVAPGTVIPAGQPYRTESRSGLFIDGATSCEFANGQPEPLKVDSLYDGAEYTMRVDSSWKPPLVLPTEPTWGIARVKPYRDSDNTRLEAGRCQIDRQYFRINGAAYSLNSVLAFAPLTDEQVARIEAAR